MPNQFPEYSPQSGWLKRMSDKNSVDIATWPKYLRDQMTGGPWSDADLTPEQRKQAAAILRARADGLEKGGE